MQYEVKKMSLFRKIIKSIFDKQYRYYCLQKVKMPKLRKKILVYLEKNQTNDEIKSIIEFIKNNDNIVYPYDFSLKYNPKTITVYEDVDHEGMKYVIHNGRKLYAKKNWSIESVQSWYSGLIKSQDIDSAHCYLKKNRYPNNGSVLADLGAAEGFFALDVLDYCKKIYLFECDSEWIESLKLTFGPYMEKIEIVNKFVGNITKDNIVKLDDFFEHKEIDYIKADIEGCEEDMLDGADNIISNKVKQILCCIYHRQTSEYDINKLLIAKGFKININPHFMLFLYAESVTGIPLKAPYLRHGVLYAYK